MTLRLSEAIQLPIHVVVGDRGGTRGGRWIARLLAILLVARAATGATPLHVLLDGTPRSASFNLLVRAQFQE